jgi:hypothetical protein
VVVLEHFLTSKSGDEAGGEDRLVITDAFAAVIDGATAKQPVERGQSPGALAANAVAEAIAHLDAECDKAAAITALDSAVATVCSAGTEQPTAVCAIYSRARRQVWRVGDTGVRINRDAFPARKEVDEVAAAFRSAILRAELLSGANEASLAAHDPGRAAIMDLLRRQSAFANRKQAGELCYAVLDGTGRAAEFAETFQVSPGDTVVLSTDGYLSPAATLAEAEDELRESLSNDPLRIGVHRSTKGMSSGAASFDDRAYLRLRV